MLKDLKGQLLSQKLLRLGLLISALFVPLSISGAVLGSVTGLAGAVIYVFRHREAAAARFRSKPLLALAILFLLSGLASMLLSADIIPSADRYRVAVGEAAMFLLFIALVDDADRSFTKKAVYLLVFSASAEALFGIAEYAAGVNIFDRPEDILASPIRRAKGTLGHFNTLGMALGMLLPLGVALTVSSIREKSKKSRALAAGTLAIAVCLMLTFTRGAWLGAFCALVAMGMAKSRKLLYASAAILVLVAVFPPSRERIIYTLTDPDMERLCIWESNIDMVKQRPVLGWGQDTFQYLFYTFYSTTPKALKVLDTNGERVFLVGKQHFHSHSVYLGLLQENGIAGLLPFLLILFLALREAFLTIKNGSTEWDRFLAWGLFGTLVDFTVHGAVDCLARAETGYLFWLLLGLVFSLEKK